MTLQEKVAEVERLLNEMKEEALQTGSTFSVEFMGGGFTYRTWDEARWDAKKQRSVKTGKSIGEVELEGTWYASNC